MVRARLQRRLRLKKLSFSLQAVAHSKKRGACLEAESSGRKEAGSGQGGEWQEGQLAGY